MPTSSAAPKDSKMSSNGAALTKNEQLLEKLRKEAYEKLPSWENELIDGQGIMAGNLLCMSTKVSDIHKSLLELTAGLDIRLIQYALIKHTEIENLKAQIETYKVEVDLLRQENYELQAESAKVAGAAAHSVEEKTTRLVQGQHKADEEKERVVKATACAEK